MKSFFGFLLGLIIMLIPLVIFHVQTFSYAGFAVMAFIVINSVIYYFSKNRPFAIASCIGCFVGLFLNWFTFYSF